MQLLGRLSELRVQTPSDRDQWFGGGQAFDTQEKSHEFRVGGHGIEAGRWHGGPHSRFHSTYTDIVELQRIVFTYDMWVDDQHLSTSLTTIAVQPEGGAGQATCLTYTEQGVHFDGLDTVEGREEGTAESSMNSADSSLLP